MEEGAVMMVGLDPKRILAAMRVLDIQPVGPNRTLRIVADYDAPDVSEKVVRIILSYTDYVNTVVWRKS
jgi:UDP-N-acetylglucosamine 2-epimerase (non-hydrolysing)